MSGFFCTQKPPVSAFSQAVFQFQKKIRLLLSCIKTEAASLHGGITPERFKFPQSRDELTQISDIFFFEDFDVPIKSCI